MFVVSLGGEIFRSMLYTGVFLLFLAVNMVQNTHQDCKIYPVPLLGLPVPVAARSEAYVCGRSHAEIVGSNPARGMDVCLL